MKASKVTMPMYGLDLGELELEEDAQHSEIGSKDWFRPAAVSMAKLNQVHTKVYNMGFKDAGSLKPPRSMRKHAQQQQRSTGLIQQKNGDMGSRTNSVAELLASFRDSEPNPPMAISSYQKTAWGSKASLLDLVTKEGKRTASRPSSAKNQTRPRPSSASRNRPQSAKEPLSDQSTDRLGVLGEKKGVCPKPSIRGHSTTAMGYIPTPEGVPRRPGRAIAGPPAGHIMDSDNADILETEEQLMRMVKSPQVPYSSPVTSDDEDGESSSRRGPLLRRPIPEPIHFSLPTVNDGAEDNGDDELNTERLLRQADDFVMKKAGEAQHCANNLSAANATLPDTSPKEDNSLVVVNSSGLISLRAGENREKEVASLSSLLPSRMRSNAKDLNDPCSKVLRSSDMGDSCEDLFYHDTSSSLDNSYDYEIQNDTYQDSQMGKEIKHKKSIDKSHQSIDRVSDSNRIPDVSKDVLRDQHSGSAFRGKKFLLPDKSDSYRPLELADTRSKQKGKPPLRNLVKFREDQNITVDITPRNQGRKITTKSSSVILEKSNSSSSGFADQCGDHLEAFCEAGLQELCLTPQSNHSNKTGKVSKTGTLANTVTLMYDDQEEDTKEKRKNVKPKKTGEPETLVSAFLESDTDSNTSVINSLHKSGAEKNYYELARAGSKTPSFLQNENPDVGRDKEGGLSGGSAVFKTTKTIEFDGEHPLETISKSALTSLHKTKDTDETGHRQQRSSTTQIWPSTIKRQQERSKARTDKLTGEQTEKDQVNDTMSKSFDELETMLGEAKTMAQASLSAAEKPPNGKKSGAGPKKPRVSSGKQSSAAAHSSIMRESPMFQEDKVIRQRPRPRSNSAHIKRASKEDIARSRQAMQSLRKDTENKRYSMYSTKPKPTPVNVSRRIKSASSATRPTRAEDKGLRTVVVEDDKYTPEKEECREMRNKMAALGVDVNIQALERALYPPSGKSQYYHVEGNLPSDPSQGLLPHYKFWVPEEYKKLQMIKRRLAQDDRIKRMLKLREEKRQKKLLAKAKADAKVMRRNSVV